ncbi:hypothetical protein KC19_5G007500 [Ceratodon purpureus]|uniref:Uncharacterized protein n=1 Tax=Ceratodon purpureus TaxID=3225 RepID=A0A8T0HXU4_CERPU|nr:hypothetical protein KC19_5G007500 [Ceratodon purpureus]
MWFSLRLIELFFLPTSESDCSSIEMFTWSFRNARMVFQLLMTFRICGFFSD